MLSQLIKELNCNNMEELVNSKPSKTPSQLRFLDLNDHCLLEIMSHLNLCDLIGVSTVCKRFECNAQRVFPHKLKLWKDIPYNDETNQFVLSKIGGFLTEVEVYNNSGISIGKTMQMIRKYCRYLEIILLHHSIPSNLLTFPSHIRNISIKFPENWTLAMGFLEGLKIYIKLESLTLNFQQFTQIDSGFLTQLPPLKQLRLKNCSVEPMDLQRCLENSKTELLTLTLNKCFPECPIVLIESVDQLVKLNELEFQFNCGPADFGPLNIFNRLTSLTLTNPTTSIDVDKFFSVLIEHNKIQTLSMNTIDNNKPLSSNTLQQLHRLTNLRRLCLHEMDFVTDDFLMAISKSKTLTHFTYEQTYRPMLSFEAVLAFVALNVPKLEKCTYIVYHDISQMDHKSEQKKELMDAYRKTVAFKRIHQCRADISNKLTSVEFLCKRIQV